MKELNWCIVLLLGIYMSSSHEQVAMGLRGSPNWRREQEEDLILDGLPGQPKVQFKQYSGYITVNATAGRALFYWLAEADTQNPLSKPLILWLSGGPGCSSIAYGAMVEVGPFNVLPDASGLSLKPYSWIKVANLLFLESPAGVGFSYTNTSSDLLTSGDKRTAIEAHTFLVKWFERFPQYKRRVFYIMGESYAGHYVPQLAKLVYDQNVKGLQNPDINLKGIMVGNGVLDHYYDNVGRVEFFWSHALISDDSYRDLMTVCYSNQTATCDDLLDYTYINVLGDIDVYTIYAPLCLSSSVQNQRIAAAKKSNSVRPSAGYDPCLANYAENYFNRPDVQKAFHANTTGIPYSWTACSTVLYENWQDSDFSMIPVYKELISTGLKIWLYSGDVDGVVPIIGTRYGVQNMNLTKQEEWFSWYLDGQVGGRCQAYEGLSVVTVQNAGHTPPWSQPKRAFVVIKSYLASGDTPLLPRNKTSS